MKKHSLLPTGIGLIICTLTRCFDLISIDTYYICASILVSASAVISALSVNNNNSEDTNPK